MASTRNKPDFRQDVSWIARIFSLAYRFHHLRWLLLVCLLPNSGHADPPSTPAGIDWRGFGTLGLARSSSDQADFVRDLSQFDGSHGNWTSDLDSMFGIQANVRLNDRAEAVFQGISRYRHEADYRPRLSLAYAQYQPGSSLSLRGGRLGTEFYMLADSRQIGYASLLVRPPVEYFGGLPFYAYDGVDVLVSRPLPSGGLLQGKLYSGYTSEKLPAGNLGTWDLSGSRIIGTYLDYFVNTWQWRLSYAQIHYKNDLPHASLYAPLDAAGHADISADLRVSGKRSHYHSLGAIHDEGPWQMQLMLSHIRHESDFYEDGWAGHLLTGYRIDAFTPYLGYSRWKTTPKQLAHPLPPPLDSLISQAMSNTRSGQHTLTLGLRWDFRENMALKAQWDRLRGRADSLLPVRNETSAWAGKSDVFSLTLDFVF